MVFFQPPTIGWDIFQFIGLLRATSNFEHFQRQSIHMGNLLLGHNICILKNLFLISNLNLPSFYVKLIPLVLSLGSGKKSFSIFLVSSIIPLASQQALPGRSLRESHCQMLRFLYYIIQTTASISGETKTERSLIIPSVLQLLCA